MCLQAACQGGNTLAAIALIESGANVNKKDRAGMTPLHYACYSSRSATAIALLKNGAVGVNDGDMFGFTPLYYACIYCNADVVQRMIQIGAILTAADLQRFRDRPAVTEEQARTVEDSYNREVNWRRRARYARFLSSIRDLVDVEHEPRPSAPAPLGEGSGVGRRTRVATKAVTQARLMHAVDKVLCRKDTQRLIGSFL